MTSLDPLFRLLVRTLSEKSPARLHQPIALNELMDAVLPYRLVRRELGVDTAEGYETILLRLCAGEGEFVQAEPEAREAWLAELKKPLPDLTLLRVYGDTHVVLRTDPMMDAMEAPPEERYAPPEARTSRAQPAREAADAEPLELPLEVPAEEPEDDDGWEADPVVELPARAAEPPPPAPAEPEETGRGPVRCPFCGGILPPRMLINFCPHCGMGQDVGACRTCGADLDVGWRYCVSCGEEVQGGAG